MCFLNVIMIERHQLKQRYLSLPPRHAKMLLTSWQQSCAVWSKKSQTTFCGQASRRRKLDLAASPSCPDNFVLMTDHWSSNQRKSWTSHETTLVLKLHENMGVHDATTKWGSVQTWGETEFSTQNWDFVIWNVPVDTDRGSMETLCKSRHNFHLSRI